VHEPPALPTGRVSTAVQRQYRLDVTDLTFLPLGLDVQAWAYRVATADGRAYFLKLRRGGVIATALRVPRALADRAASHVVAPLPTVSGELWVDLDPYTLALYPYIDGATGMARGLSERHWVAFGAALRQVHAAALPLDVAADVPRESFTLAQLFQRLRQSPWAAVIAELEALATAASAAEPSLRELAAWWRAQRPVVLALADRFTALGERLRRRGPELVLCHADIHPNNLLIDRDGDLWLVDWDEVLYAPKECDLMMGIGGLGHYAAGPTEAAWFLDGYGRTDVDSDALAFYRHARALGDFGAEVEQIILPTTGAAARRDLVQRLQNLFAPGRIVSLAQASDAPH